MTGHKDKRWELLIELSKHTGSSRFIDDKKVHSLLIQLQAELNKRLNDEFIDETTQFDFARSNKTAVFSISEPTSFIDGFNKAAAIISFLFSIAHKSKRREEIKSFLVDRLKAAVDDGYRSDFIHPVVQEMGSKEEIEAANHILKVSANMRKQAIIASLRKWQSSRDKIIAEMDNIDVDALGDEMRKVRKNIADQNKILALWKTTQLLPKDYPVAHMFKNEPQMQIECNILVLNDKLEELEATRSRMEDAVRQIDVSISELQAELDSLERVDHLDIKPA